MQHYAEAAIDLADRSAVAEIVGGSLELQLWDEAAATILADPTERAILVAAPTVPPRIAGADLQHQSEGAQWQ